MSQHVHISSTCEKGIQTLSSISGRAYLVIRPAQQVAGARIEDGVCGGAGGRASLGDLICQILDQDGVGRLVQGGKAIARKEDCTCPDPSLAFLRQATWMRIMGLALAVASIAKGCAKSCTTFLSSSKGLTPLSHG